LLPYLGHIVQYFTSLVVLNKHSSIPENVTIIESQENATSSFNILIAVTIQRRLRGFGRVRRMSDGVLKDTLNSELGNSSRLSQPEAMIFRDTTGS